jgi:hypothetical protein
MDATYGAAGKVTLAAPFDGGTRYGPSRLAVDADGSLYVAGLRELTKLDPSGVPAASFGSGGRVPVQTYEGDRAPYGPPVLDEAGNVHAISQDGISKFDSSGSPLSCFGTDGFVWVPNAYGLYGLARGPGGNLYVIPGRLMESPSSFEVAKLDRDGRLLPSFGVLGKAVVDVGLGGEEAGVTSTTVDANGNFYAAGWVGLITGHYTAFVTKLDPAGNRVETFNPALGGVVRVMPCSAPAHSIATDLVVDAAGNVFMAGECRWLAGPTRMTSFVVKIAAGGANDPTYAGATSVPTLFGPEGGVTVILRKANGELIIAGNRPNPSVPLNCGYEVVVAKLDAMGDPIPLPSGEGLLALQGVYPGDLGIDGYGRLYATTSRGTCSPHTVMAPEVQIYRVGS